MFTNTTTPLLTDIKITRRQKHLCITGLCCVKFYLNCYRLLYTWRKAQVHSAVRLNSKAAAPQHSEEGNPSTPARFSPIHKCCRRKQHAPVPEDCFQLPNWNISVDLGFFVCLLFGVVLSKYRFGLQVIGASLCPWVSWCPSFTSYYTVFCAMSRTSGLEILWRGVLSY